MSKKNIKTNQKNCTQTSHTFKTKKKTINHFETVSMPKAVIVNTGNVNLTKDMLQQQQQQLVTSSQPTLFQKDSNITQQQQQQALLPEIQQPPSMENSISTVNETKSANDIITIHNTQQQQSQFKSKTPKSGLTTTLASFPENTKSDTITEAGEEGGEKRGCDDSNESMLYDEIEEIEKERAENENITNISDLGGTQQQQQQQQQQQASQQQRQQLQQLQEENGGINLNNNMGYYNNDMFDEEMLEEMIINPEWWYQGYYSCVSVRFDVNRMKQVWIVLFMCVVCVFCVFVFLCLQFQKCQGKTYNFCCFFGV